MIIRKESTIASIEEINGIVQQIYERLILLLETDAGNFTTGLIFKWSDDKIIDRVRLSQRRMQIVIDKNLRRWLDRKLINQYKELIPVSSSHDRLPAQQFLNQASATDEDISVHREFQRLKLKAIQQFQTHYTDILGTVPDGSDTMFKMMTVIEFVAREKLAIVKDIDLACSYP